MTIEIKIVGTDEMEMKKQLYRLLGDWPKETWSLVDVKDGPTHLRAMKHGIDNPNHLKGAR